MKKNTTTIPYFKLDTGRFLSDISGFSAAHIGYYVQLLAHYWEKGGDLPPLASLKRMLYVRTEKQAQILDDVLAEFFPNNKSEHLDSCLKEVNEAREKQSASGKASAAARKARAEAAAEEDEEEEEDEEYPIHKF